jgi:hypothetical protein
MSFSKIQDDRESDFLIPLGGIHDDLAILHISRLLQDYKHLAFAARLQASRVCCKITSISRLLQDYKDSRFDLFKKESSNLINSLPSSKVAE